MSTNPFDDEDSRFFVLINDEERYCLWPSFADIPSGWHRVLGEGSRHACIEYFEKNWTDMRPESLRQSISANAAAAQVTEA
ncbi:MbtH family protein [Nocardia sp. NPDC051981]|uniref:MbtH family protein n=1 Tax=Nocardia sp. NPDC051981 TaxID=3155417 RepID=UPI0034331D35